MRRSVIVVWAATLAAVMGGAFLLSSRTRDPSEMPADSSPSRTTVSRDGTLIAWTAVGTGPPIVLVDGAFCFRGHGPCRDLARTLAPRFTVYSYDRRGRGGSGDAAAYDIARELEDLQAVLALTGAPADVVAVSSGGALALQAAAAGTPIRRLVLYEPPYVASNGTLVRRDGDIAQLKQRLSARDAEGAVRLFMTDVLGVPKLMVAFMPLLTPGTWKLNVSVAKTLVYDLTLMNDASVLGARAGLVRVPTLVLAGAESPAALREAAARVGAALPNGRTRLIEGQSHRFDADKVAPAVAAFLIGG